MDYISHTMYMYIPVHESSTAARSQGNGLVAVEYCFSQSSFSSKLSSSCQICLHVHVHVCGLGAFGFLVGLVCCISMYWCVYTHQS